MSASEFRKWLELGSRYLHRRLPTIQEVDHSEIVSDMIGRMLEKGVFGEPKEKAYFFASCRNAGIDRIRSGASRPTVPLDDCRWVAHPSQPSDRIEGMALRESLEGALPKLRPNYLRALEEKAAGYTARESAANRGISLTAAKVSRLRAERKLRAAMTEVANG